MNDNPSPCTQAEYEALVFDAEGANAEVVRLRQAIDRIELCIPAGNAATDVETAVLQAVGDVRTWAED